MTPTLNPNQLRRIVQTTWIEVTTWMTGRTKLFELPHPEQQILFELAFRLRENLRSVAQDPAWDRLYFDASAASSPYLLLSELSTRRPNLRVETRKLAGVKRASTENPDLAIELCVLRSADEIIDFDDDGHPRHHAWVPVSMDVQGRILEESVQMLSNLSRRSVEGFLFVVYTNAAKRETGVDTRNVASWASWAPLGDTLSWASRHFKARPPTPTL